MDDTIKFIQGVGFPVAVAAFVLIRLDQSMRSLCKEVHDLLVYLRTEKP